MANAKISRQELRRIRREAALQGSDKPVRKIVRRKQAPRRAR